jgi:hypothetical protein
MNKPQRTAQRDNRRFPPVPEQHPQEPVSGQEEIEDPDEDLMAAAGAISPDTAAKASAWIAKKNASIEEITSIVYKEKPEGGKKQCGQWKNLIPDDHNIGVLFGAGRYSLWVQFPATKNHPAGFNRWDFELDGMYDVYKKEAQQSGNFPLITKTSQIPQLPAAPAGNGIDNTLAIITALIPLLRPPQQESISESIKTSMMMFQMMNEVMKKSLMDNAEFFGEMQEMILDLKERNLPEPPEGDEQKMLPSPTDKPKGFLELALPYLAPILTKLVGATPEEITTTGAMVGAIPAVKDIITNPKHKADCKQLITYLDKQLKPEKTDEILKALKVDRAQYV